VWVRQVGVLKDRNQVFRVIPNLDGQEGDEKTELLVGRSVEKPIAFGLDMKWVKTTIAKIRAAHMYREVGFDREVIGLKHGPGLVKEVKLKFPGQVAQNERLGTHFLRALYANVAYHFFRDEIGSSLTSFISDVLAHDSRSLTTALSYQTLHIQFGLPEKVEASTKETANLNRINIDDLYDQLKDLVTLKEKMEVVPGDMDAKLPLRERIVNGYKRGQASIELEAKNGKPVTITYNRHTGKETQDLRTQRAEATAKALQRVKGIKRVNGQMLRDVGFGARTTIRIAMPAEKRQKT
jgi:hypothetical protein